MTKIRFKIRIITMIACLSIMIACDDDEKPNQCKIEGLDIARSNIFYGSENNNVIYSAIADVSYLFEYDTTGHISQLQFDVEEDICQLGTSGELECKETLESGSFEFIYDSNTVYLMSDGGEVLIETLYDGDLIEKVTYFYLDGQAERVDEYRYFYTESQLSKIENWDNFIDPANGELILNEYDEFSYTGENITKVVSYYESGNTNSARKKNKVLSGPLNLNARKLDFLKRSEVIYTYDNQRNPYKGSLIGIIFEDFAYFNTNNIASEVHNVVYSDGSTFESETINNTYEYNENGFPVSFEYLDASSDNNSETDKFSFMYDCN